MSFMVARLVKDRPPGFKVILPIRGKRLGKLRKVYDEYSISTASEFAVFLNSISYRCNKLYATSIAELDETTKDLFFRVILKKMIRSILQMPELFPSGCIEVLKDDEERVFTNHQIFCIISSLFICFFPNVRDFKKILMYNPQQTKSFIKYFQNYDPSVTYHVSFRKIKVSEDQVPDYRNSTKGFTNVRVVKKKVGVQEMKDCDQVVFSNENIGGLFFNGALLQEESIFTEKCESVISMLFCDRMRKNEVIIIKGAQRFVRLRKNSVFTFRKYRRGYFERQVVGHENACLFKKVPDLICMDSSNNSSQFFDMGLFSRDIFKCFIGFSDPRLPTKSIATGAWGCGAFNHDRVTKFVQQFIVCSELGKENMVFCSFGDILSTPKIERLLKLIYLKEKQGKLNVGILCNLIPVEKEKVKLHKFFEYIFREIQKL